MKKILEWLKALPWAKAAKAALQIIVPAAVGSGAAILAGCSDLRPSAKTQTMSLYAIGIPGIAVVTQSTQDADNRGDDENKPTQANPVTVEVPIK
ncbi:MAG: hypothetical protein IJI68_00120 [Eggerthellaceae bacterium]|nr:hypothetical protein [Eggerthellaceae bacterium]